MKKCARDFHIDVFWKEVTILIARVGESWVETHQPLQNLKEKNNYEKGAHCIISNKNHVCMEANCNIFLINLVHQFFRFDIPSISLDILSISFPMSLPISGKPGITIINALYMVFCKKTWFNKKFFSLLPVSVLHHRNSSILDCQIPAA